MHSQLKKTLKQHLGSLLHTKSNTSVGEKRVSEEMVLTRPDPPIQPHLTSFQALRSPATVQHG